jgi:hypothetical protein
MPRVTRSAQHTLSPLGAVVTGLIAGAVGTFAMDLLWFGRYKRGGGTSGFMDWEFSAGLKDWESAPVPAKVGKRFYEVLLQQDLPPERAGLTNNVVHWGYGMLWGAFFAILAGSGVPRVRHGLIFGPFVWTVAYALLAPMKLYRPMWEYDTKTLADDLSAHVVFGVATAAAFKALSR